MDDEQFRERWLSAPVALSKAETIARKHGGIDEPLGLRMLRMAALGKLSVVAKERDYMKRLSEDELDHHNAQREALSDDDYYQWIRNDNKRVRDKYAGLGPSHKPVPFWWWAPFLAIENDYVIDGYHVNLAHQSFDREGYFSWILTRKRYKYDEAFSVVLGDPDTQMQSVRGVYFLEHDLFNVAAPKSRLAELEDSTFDLSIADFIESDESEQDIGLPKQNEASGSQKKSSAGGRRGGKHGEAIAKVAIQLAGLDMNELDRYTAISIIEELRVAYQEAGGVPPSPENLERYAAGILRSCRARS